MCISRWRLTRPCSAMDGSAKRRPCSGSGATSPAPCRFCPTGNSWHVHVLIHSECSKASCGPDATPSSAGVPIRAHQHVQLRLLPGGRHVTLPLVRHSATVLRSMPLLSTSAAVLAPGGCEGFDGAGGTGRPACLGPAGLRSVAHLAAAQAMHGYSAACQPRVSEQRSGYSAASAPVTTRNSQVAIR